MKDRGDNERRAWRVLGALLPAAVLVFALGLVPASAATGKKKHRPRPNLVIAKIEVKELPGDPPYIALDENSRAPGFRIAVTTMNYGRAVGPTTTDLKLELNGDVIWHGRAHVEKLGHRHSQRHTWVIAHLKADPGFLEPVAIADAANAVKESDEHNVKAAPIIPVVPRDWKVDTFRTTVNRGGGLTETTQTANGFYYRLSRFDETEKYFVYEAFGPVTTKADLVGGGCEGHGSGQATENPWPGPDSELVLKGNLSAYSGGVETDKEPPITYMATCGGGAKFPEQVGYINLITWVGTHSFPPMAHDATTLDGDGTAQTPVGPAQYTWHFVARLSGA